MSGQESRPEWMLVLYIAGMTPAAKRAWGNVKRLCEEHLPGKYSLELVDLLEHAGLAEAHQIFAVPTLVREFPRPLRKIIGDLSNAEQLLMGLELCAAA